jgi:hypothetical protein
LFSIGSFSALSHKRADFRWGGEVLLGRIFKPKKEGVIESCINCIMRIFMIFNLHSILMVRRNYRFGKKIFERTRL